MSKLSAFLNPAPIQEEKDVVVSKRFTDEDGNVVPFRIRSMSQEETEAITKKATIREKVNGGHRRAQFFLHRTVPAVWDAGPQPGPWQDAASGGVQCPAAGDFAAFRSFQS